MRSSHTLITATLAVAIIGCQRDALPLLQRDAATSIDQRTISDEGATTSHDGAGPKNDADSGPRLDRSLPDGPAGLCFKSADCGANSFCKLDDCHANKGICALRPTGCRGEGAPVCGCDNRTYDSPCAAHREGVTVRDNGKCTGTTDPCASVRCKPINDCCTCAAVEAAAKPDQCLAVCDAPRCAEIGLSYPVAYCAAGRCFVGSTEGCTDDGDCRLVDDCCHCVALPKSIPLRHSCSHTCFVPSCLSYGRGTAAAACIGGRCRIRFSL